MNEDQIYVTIKFVTGDTCVGALMENNALSVVIANPITITTGLDQQDGEMVERLVMNKFCYLTDDQFFTFNKKDIIFCASLKESLIGPYKKLCMADQRLKKNRTSIWISTRYRTSILDHQH